MVSEEKQNFSEAVSTENGQGIPEPVSNINLLDLWFRSVRLNDVADCQSENFGSTEAEMTKVTFRRIGLDEVLQACLWNKAEDNACSKNRRKKRRKEL